MAGGHPSGELGYANREPHYDARRTPQDVQANGHDKRCFELQHHEMFYIVLN